jgi:diguanylate cyclase (GGDEF)-like protein
LLPPGVLFMGIWTLGLPIPIALAVVALVGYVIGRRFARQIPANLDATGRRELQRAEQVIRELEEISRDVRRNLARHEASIGRFRERVGHLSKAQDPAGWQALSEEAERVLKPTLKLSAQMAHAYDEIRQQTNMLMLFTEVRADALTGLSNRRAMEEALHQMLAMKARYDFCFSLAIVDLDYFKAINDRHGHLHGDQVLVQFAELMRETARETDLLNRYGGEEFVVIMPQTGLSGGCVFCERLRRNVAERQTYTISGGVAVAERGDSLQDLLSRADAALYRAKSSGRNCVFRHNGTEIEPVTSLRSAEGIARQDPPSHGGSVTLNAPHEAASEESVVRLKT